MSAASSSPATASACTAGDPDLEAALEKRFRLIGSSGRIDRSAEISTERSAVWDIFVGEQACRVTQKLVRMIVVNKVEIEPEFRKTGILKQGIGLLMTRFALIARAPILELNAVQNRHLYSWALRQPNVYVSPYNPECVHLYIDFSSDDFANLQVPAELRAQSKALLEKLVTQPAVDENMANSRITQELMARIGEERLADERPEQVKGYTAADIEMSRAYLSSMRLHDACKPWIQENCARLYDCARLYAAQQAEVEENA